MKLSNKFTTMRLVFAPIFFLLYNIPLWTHSELLCKISSFIMLPLLAIFELTDYFDGHFARKYGEVSDFGKLYDPFADVILNLTVFLCALKSVSAEIGAYMPLIIFALILYREFFNEFHPYDSGIKRRCNCGAQGGKIKTVFYITSGFFALLIESLLRLNIPLPCLSQLKIVAIILFSICLLLSYISFIDYIKTFCKILK